MMNPMVKYIILIAVVLSLGGMYLYSSGLDTVPSGKAYKIVAFGDSLTEGYKVDPKDSYPSILEAKLREINPNITIVNKGVSGDTVTEGLARIDDVLKEKPDVVLLGLGANDLLRNLPVADAKAGLEKMIVRFQEQGITVVLLGVKSSINSRPEYRKEFDAMYPDLAEKYNLVLVPSFLDGVVLSSRYTISDRLHPNAEGYVKIVDENVFPKVKGLFK